MCKKIFIILAFLALIVLAEPLGRSLSLAVTYVDNPRVSTEHPTPVTVEAPVPKTTTPQKTHAPEPSSLFFFFSGLMGAIVRFAQRSFEKFKRVSDLFLATLGLLIASPILFLAAVLIKLTSKGPIVYRQDRVGRNNQVFRIYKLRTMCFDAEKETGAVWAKENDPRITQLGRILRKTHIDEIPQLFNVLKGEMSIVGPRPERPEIVRDLKTLIRDYEKRLKVKPGITGLAQIFYKYDETIEDVKKKIKYDFLYIKRMCWLVDLRIIAKTFAVVLVGKGAR